MTGRPELAPGVVLHEVDDCYVAYEPQGRQAVALNPTASHVVQLCDGQREVEQLVTGLADHYGQDPAVLRPQVQALLEQLTDAGVLRR